jgi:hypothetical protein
MAAQINERHASRRELSIDVLVAFAASCTTFQCSVTQLQLFLRIIIDILGQVKLTYSRMGKERRLRDGIYVNQTSPAARELLAC